ncbi:LTA synthase family protein [uncultured Clostridium sp.]|uniref:LTA synthase family protein n=1 Tax=uncultured Clostridium sp. TaxID=59620 RepID=UPI0026001427|nr:LTA synthase family protein [uncultured Clostridium sp.]
MNFTNKINKFLNRDTLLRVIFFLIPAISIVLKGIIFQSFVSDDNPFKFNLISGYSVISKYYLNYYAAFAFLLTSFSLLFKGKGRIIYLFILDAVVTLLFVLDTWYFRGFQTVPSLLLLSQTSNLDNMSDSILSLISPLDVIYFSDFLIMGVYLAVTKKSFINCNRALKGFLITFITSLLFIIYVPFNINVLNNKEIKNAYLFDVYDPNITVKYFSTIGYHIMDAYTVYHDTKPYELTVEDKENIHKLIDIKNEHLPDNEYFGAAKSKNIIYIQVESLESFVINKKVNNLEITPVMNSLLSNSVYFPNIYEQVNEGTSSDADFMTNTSLLPVRRGCTFFRYPNNNYNSLPKILSSHGYMTNVIHPDKGSFWNYQNALSGGIGFEKFTDYYSFDHTEEIGMGISDKSYFEQVVSMLKDLDKPFYAMTVTLTNHGPFNLPKEYRCLNLSPELNENNLGGYFESVHYTDAQIGHFIDLLDDQGILNNSIIVITGDHSGVHKYYNDDINKLSYQEDWYLDNGNHTVPIIIYDHSSSLKSKTFDELLGGQIDLMPTILYLLGIPSDEYSYTALGRNLLNTNKSFAVITDGTVKGAENLTDDEISIYSKSLDISDKMIRSNYNPCLVNNN